MVHLDMILKPWFYSPQAYKFVVNDTSVFRLELPLKNKGVGAKTHPESKCPELLANYCDMLLRKTPLSKKLTSEEVEKKLKDVVCIFFIILCRVHDSPKMDKI